MSQPSAPPVPPASRRSLPSLLESGQPAPQRSTGAPPAGPLLLLVHGRAGGVIPEELQALAAELALGRGAAVGLLALSDPSPVRLPEQPPAVGGQTPAATTLVPLLLLPGGHVRRDLPALVTQLRRQGALRHVPFLGSWPGWQRTLALELASLTTVGAQTPPLLLHHPLTGPLAERYLTLLAHRCGAMCRPAAFVAPAGGSVELELPAGTAFLPLALAANRLTESLRERAPAMAARPLLARPRLRRSLMEMLLALP